MARVVVVLVGLLLSLGRGVGQAGTLTIDVQGTAVSRTTTANQDARLGKLRDRSNAQRAAQTPPQSAQTTNQFLDDVVLACVQGQLQQLDTLEGKDFCTQWPTFTAAQRNAVLALPGGFSPCP